jgi:hypothetical protein
MSSRRWILLSLISLVVTTFAVVWIRDPGYTDADYYFATARELVAGHGFNEPFIWNFLDNPEQVRHPSHLYWMPLTSILAAIPMWLFGSAFRIAQLPFMLFTISIPLITARLSQWLGSKEEDVWLTGLLACISGFYLPYLVTTETFSLYAVIGVFALWMTAIGISRPGKPIWFAIGLMVGFAHLTRADGVILLALSFIALFLSKEKVANSIIVLLLGYLLVIGPWMVRTQTASGFFLSPASSRVMWMSEYNDLFLYPPEQLTFKGWWDSGLNTILSSRWIALRTNLVSLLVVNGVIYLWPFMFIGAYKHRNEPIVRLSFFYLLLLLIMMSVVFPFAGSRGGYFHSSVILMPVLWAFAPRGLDAVIHWASLKRGWRLNQARKVFRTSAVFLALFLTGIIFFNRVLGTDWRHPKWSSSARTYQMLGEVLEREGVEPEVVVVNNPPGFFLATGIPAVVIPDGPPSTLRQVVERYGVELVILDVNHVDALSSLYHSPRLIEWLNLLDTQEDEGGKPIHIFEVKK